MDGWIDGWMNESLDGYIDGWLDRSIDRWMDMYLLCVVQPVVAAH